MLSCMVHYIVEVSLRSDRREQIHQHRSQVCVHLLLWSFVTKSLSIRGKPKALPLSLTQQQRSVIRHRVQLTLLAYIGGLGFRGPGYHGYALFMNNTDIAAWVQHNRGPNHACPGVNA